MTEFRAVDRLRSPTPSQPRTRVQRSATPAGMITNLQRLAGNRAVTTLVQRDEPSGSSIGSARRFGADDSDYKLRLDPQIQAQIRAIEAMRARVAPEPVRAGLVNLTLPELPPELRLPAAPAPSPVAPTPSTPRPGPAPGTGLTGPRAGSVGDIWQAVLADPTLGTAITDLGNRAADRAKAGFSSLSTGGQAAVVSTSIVVGAGALTGLLANPASRDWLTATLSDKIIPVVVVPGLGVQLNLSGPAITVGLHLDVGKILPASMGFGPASQSTPLGAPPGPF